MLTYAISHKGHTYLLPFVEERDEGRYSIYLLYWYKSTNTDAQGATSDLMPSWLGLNIPIETLPAQVC
jgi:hypothetical protein